MPWHYTGYKKRRVTDSDEEEEGDERDERREKCQCLLFMHQSDKFHVMEIKKRVGDSLALRREENSSDGVSRMIISGPGWSTWYELGKFGRTCTETVLKLVSKSHVGLDQKTDVEVKHSVQTYAQISDPEFLPQSHIHFISSLNVTVVFYFVIEQRPVEQIKPTEDQIVPIFEQETTPMSTEELSKADQDKVMSDSSQALVDVGFWCIKWIFKPDKALSNTLSWSPLEGKLEGKTQEDIGNFFNKLVEFLISIFRIEDASNYVPPVSMAGGVMEIDRSFEISADFDDFDSPMRPARTVKIPQALTGRHKNYKEFLNAMFAEKVSETSKKKMREKFWSLFKYFRRKDFTKEYRVFLHDRCNLCMDACFVISGFLI